MISVEHKGGQVTVDGHAGYAPKGQDIVCEAVTALVQTYIRSLEYLTDDKARYSLSPGHAYIKDPLSPEGFLLMQSFLLGMRLLAEAYPENVEIKHFDFYAHNE